MSYVQVDANSANHANHANHLGTINPRSISFVFGLISTCIYVVDMVWLHNSGYHYVVLQVTDHFRDVILPAGTRGGFELVSFVSSGIVVITYVYGVDCRKGSIERYVARQSFTYIPRLMMTSHCELYAVPESRMEIGFYLCESPTQLD